MRDIPVFTTQFGVASLTFGQIPYTAEAYIKIHDSQSPETFLQECCDFCKAAGAEMVYASGHRFLEKYPLHTAIWRMIRSVEGLPETNACLVPLQENTMEKWRSLYNERMRHIPNASFMTCFDGKQILANGNAYFVQRGDTLLGIGIAAGNRIDAVVALQSGAGEDVLLALCHALSGDVIELEVASSNVRAIKLYQRLGFLQDAEISKWYKII